MQKEHIKTFVFLLNKNNFIIFSPCAEQSKFRELVEGLKTKFDPSNFLVTVSIKMGEQFKSGIYDFKSLSESMEFISLEHNFLKAVDSYFTKNDALEFLGVKNFKNKIENLLQTGVAPSKIVAEIFLAGLKMEGQENALEVFKGMSTYQAICAEIKKKSREWTKTYGTYELSVFTNKKRREIIVIESIRSILNKVRFAMKQGLAGIATIHVTCDDFATLMRIYSAIIQNTTTLPFLCCAVSIHRSTWHCTKLTKG